MANRKMLLVEGNDDEHVVKHICGTHDISPVLDIKTLGSVERLMQSIRASIDSAGDDGDVVGILVDADQNLQSRWQSVRAQLADAGYPDLPDLPDSAGVIIEPPDDGILPRAGVWIMPDNQGPGTLESFLHSMVPDNQRSLFEYASTSVAGIPAAKRRFRPVDTPKAIIHTWLAWQENPGRPFGTAITARFLNPDAVEAAGFAAWLRSLFFANA